MGRHRSKFDSVLFAEKSHSLEPGSESSSRGGRGRFWATERFIDIGVAALASACFTATVMIALCPTLFMESSCTSENGVRNGVISSTGGPGARGSCKVSRFHIDTYAVNGPIMWSHLPPALQSEFSLEGRINVLEWEQPPKYLTLDTQTVEWTTEDIDKMVALADTRQPDVNYTLCSYGPECNNVFFQALEQYPVKGNDVLVVGSRWPWVETIALSFGAASVTTVDFNVPICKDPRIRTLSIEQLDATEARFDAVFSFSSIEHDGLGRYGDPINPIGDLQRMEKLQGLLNDHGKLYLGVPNGNDSITFFAHRVYGPIRFPMLISGWRLLQTFSRTPLEGIYRLPGFTFTQPLHVLEVERR